jgi:ribosomal protein S18 acetylase RimI-like enzyme
MIKIVAAGPDDIPVIRQLADDTWFSTYRPILSEGQVQYMFDKFYTASALQHQMSNEGHRFLLAYHNDAPAGFASFSVIEPGTVKLHKLYVLPALQGHGLGAALTDRVAGEARKTGADRMILYVNRHNHPAQKFYEKMGLRNIREEVIDIGQGYVMDDYILELTL